MKRNYRLTVAITLIRDDNLATVVKEAHTHSFAAQQADRLAPFQMVNERVAEAIGELDELDKPFR